MIPSTKPKLLFLNPPGKRVYIRDYFCSKISQADYINHPIDFVCLSGSLMEHFDLFLIDAIVERTSINTCIRKIKEIQPDVILGLIGSVSYREDVPFYQKLSETIQAKLILIGDILIDNRRERLEKLFFVDAFLHDFSSNDLLAYLNYNGNLASDLSNLTIRRNGAIFTWPIVKEKRVVWNSSIPDHSLFLKKGIAIPSFEIENSLQY